jgi:hypothetical protein
MYLDLRMVEIKLWTSPEFVVTKILASLISPEGACLMVTMLLPLKTP